MSKELTTLKRQVPTIPAALKALAAMRHQLTMERTYAALQRIIQRAEALKVLMRDVSEVKEAAEKTVLMAHRRIAQELKGVDKATYKGGPKKQNPQAGTLVAGRIATGIPKNTRSRVGKLLGLSDDELEAAADKLHAKGKDATVRAVVEELTQGSKKERRAERERELAGKIVALPDKRYGVILADPEWDDAVWSRESGMDRHAANHYPTSDASVIAARPVGTIAAKDCVLFLWTTNQHLRIAIGVLEAWGFEYKSNYVWGKSKIGMGRWNRSKHELLLIGTHGKVPCPAPGEQWESLIMAPSGRHSAKPDVFYEMIESYYPTIPKIELNCRGEPRTGWDGWGAEVQEAAE